ncbi:D-lactaldehyde dehydrogenase [Coprinopsis sp. MPI-PUGE-AT-0042]|nr:D-lactaldehyde dehydrogenase [Coprinopsis sp. MPI-PUGE-AT-0042]
MPTISSTDKVLVTGANGYIGLWIVKTLLERGNPVRAAVRSEAKGNHLKELFKSYGDQLELAIVPDITKEGAFDNAVNGVQAIVHTATVVDFSNPKPKPETFIKPAVDGTLRALEAALKYKNDIKRIVITTSMAAVAGAPDPSAPAPPPSHPPFQLTEDIWNEASLKIVEEKGDEAGALHIYSASKVLAERAARDFVKKHKDEISWDLTTIVPPFVFGPLLGDFNSIETVSGSVTYLLDNLLPKEPKPREALGSPSAWVDVRDVAEAHVRSLEKEKAGGERILVVAEAVVWQDFVDVAVKLNLPGREFPKGFPDLSRDLPFVVDTKKSKEILGLTYRSKEETVKDIFDDFTKRGF